MVHREVLPDVQLCQGLARSHRTQHTVHPVHREPVVAETVESGGQSAGSWSP